MITKYLSLNLVATARLADTVWPHEWI